MQSYKCTNGTVFQFSSDFSGPAHIIAASGEQLKIEGEDLEEFIQEIRGRQLQSVTEGEEDGIY